MAGAFKVRLEDGVEVGPLDVEMLRSWWQQGMISRDSSVLPQGRRSWVRLTDAVDVSTWGAAGGASVGRPSRRAVAGAEAEAVEVAPQAWRTYAASGLLFLFSAGAGYFAFLPDRWLVVLADTPWREIALGLAALGLLLVRGWEPGRKAARVTILFLTFAMFPLAGLVLYRGIQLPTVMILVSTWAVGSGLFFFLAGQPLGGLSIASSLFWILAGATGIAYFGYVPARPASASVEPGAPATPAVTAPPAAADAPPALSVAAITQEVPVLSARAAEAVLARGVHNPVEAFRRAYELASSGLPALSGEEKKALAEITAATYSVLSPKDRGHLASYMERVRSGSVTLPQEDRDMSALVRDAVLKLAEPQRAQLQSLHEKAVVAAR